MLLFHLIVSLLSKTGKIWKGINSTWTSDSKGKVFWRLAKHENEKIHTLNVVDIVTDALKTVPNIIIVDYYLNGLIVQIRPSSQLKSIAVILMFIINAHYDLIDDATALS